MLSARKMQGYRPSIEAAHMPAPIGGINAIDAGTALPELDCIYLYNLIGAEYGLRSRLGYLEWCTGLTGATENTVRSILPFSGSHLSGSTDKLFACTTKGVWDVSASSASPSQLVTFGTQTGDAGFGVAAVMTTSAGRFLLYCDEVNGYYVWSENSAAWTQVTQGGGASQINGVNPANFAGVCVWKNRAWFIEKDTSKAWYLGTNAIYGTATSFDFGAKMGGPLAMLYNWSYDGGSGMDTLLVAISTSGAVSIYSGTDPSSASTFGLVGTWHLGGVPYGRRIATDNGGDLLVLSLLGVMPLSKLVQGKPIDDRKVYETYKIANLFNSLASSYRTLQGWGVYIHPEDNALLVAYPTASLQNTSQLAMSYATRGWSRYRDLPLFSAAAWNGTFYIGTADGRVCKNTGYIDDVLLSNPNSYSPVAYSLLTRYENLGNGRQKQVQEVRAIIESQTPSPSYQVTAKFNFDLLEPSPPVGGTVGQSGTWDNATWDTSVWSGDYSPSTAITGCVGMGRDVALAMRGNATSRTTIVGWDVHFTQGGLL